MGNNLLVNTQGDSTFLEGHACDTQVSLARFWWQGLQILPEFLSLVCWPTPALREQDNLKGHWSVYSVFRWLPFRLCPVVPALMPERSKLCFLSTPYCALQRRVLGRVEEEKWSGREKPSDQSDPALPGMWAIPTQLSQSHFYRLGFLFATWDCWTGGSKVPTCSLVLWVSDTEHSYPYHLCSFWAVNRHLWFISIVVMRMVTNHLHLKRPCFIIVQSIRKETRPFPTNIFITARE